MVSVKMTSPVDNPERLVRESGVLRNTLHDLISRLNASNRKLVEALVRQLISLQQLENPNAEALSNVNLLDWLPNWINHLEVIRRSPETIRVYTLFVKGLLSNFPQPTHVLIEAYLAFKTGEGTSANSIASRVAAFKSFFGYLTQAGVLNQDPSEHLKNPKVPFRTRTLPRKDDLATLLQSEFTTPRDKALLLLGIGCGLRIHEAISLRVSDIDFEHSELTVIGKGNKQRTVAMPQEVAQALIECLADLPAATRFVFPSSKPKIHLTTAAAVTRLHKLCSFLGVEQITPHQLRHYFTTTLLNSGADLKAVSNMLGHSSPEPTARVYWHLENAKSQHATMDKHNPIRGLLAGNDSQPGGN